MKANGYGDPFPTSDDPVFADMNTPEKIAERDARIAENERFAIGFTARCRLASPEFDDKEYDARMDRAKYCGFGG